MNIASIDDKRRLQEDAMFLERASRHADLELVFSRAEDTYFKSTGRTRYQFAIDALEFLVDRLVMMDREELGKSYLLELADELNQRGDDSSDRRKRSEAARAALKSSVLMLPHRREREGASGASA